jgi:glycosyltransferase involved in cell wall biosynthesis
VFNGATAKRRRKGMRILLMPSSYAPVLGGLQTVAQALAHHLRGLGHEVRVVTNRYPRSLPRRETVDDVPVERWQFLRPCWGQLRRGRADLFLASLYYAPRTRGRLRRLLQEFRPDVVNVHFPDGQIPFVLGLRQRFGFRLAVSLHGHEVERFTGEEGAAGAGRLRALLREADAVTACSGNLLERAAALESSVAAKGTAIYNGIDPARFEDKVPHKHARPYILALGRLTYKKGFDLLLEALARAGGAAADVDLIVAGEGEERGTLEALAARLGLGSRVKFHGRATSAEVVRLLNGCRFFAIPSRAEPFGIVALEALAAGKPVLATRVGGMEEFLGHVTGRLRLGPSLIRLVEPRVERLAEGLRERLASAPEGDRRWSESVLATYSWARVAQRYERLLAGSAAAAN